MNYCYDTKFEGNILIVGRTGCGETTFVQNLGKKNLGKIKEVIWVLKIPHSKDRENNIRKRFIDEEMGFKYPNSLDEFDDLLDYFQRPKAPCNENFLGESIKLDKLIVMDDVSGLADKSKAFANFITVSRIFGPKCVYIFHAIHPTRQKWQMILAQTKIFTIFPGFIQASSIVKILPSFFS